MRIPKTLSIVAAAILLGAAGSFAQIKSPAASPYSELKQMVGVTEFTVKYSRPGVKGREVCRVLWSLWAGVQRDIQRGIQWGV